MKFSEEIYKKIEAYVKETMSVAERRAFEKELQADPELAEEVEFYRKVRLQYGERSWYFAKKNRNHPEVKALKTYFKSEDARELSDKIRQVENRYKKSAVRIRRRKFFYYAAASIVVLVLAGYFFVSFNSMETLYHSNYESSVLLHLMERSDTDWLTKEVEAYLDTVDYATISPNEIINEIEKISDIKPTFCMVGEWLFKQEKYTEAIPFFLLYLKEDSTELRSKALKLLGFSYVETQQYEKAIRTFEDLLYDTAIQERIREKAYWYMALTYLKQGDKEKTRQQLKIVLSNPHHYYYDEAKDLERELKKISIVRIFS